MLKGAVRNSGQTVSILGAAPAENTREISFRFFCYATIFFILEMSSLSCS